MPRRGIGGAGGICRVRSGGDEEVGGEGGGDSCNEELRRVGGHGEG